MSTQTPARPAAPEAAPSGPDPMDQALAMVRPWIEYIPPQQRRLGLFIFLALMVHLATFFFIRIDTIRAEMRHQIRPHVTVDGAQAASISGQPAGDDFWDRMNDPRVYLFPSTESSRSASGNQPFDFTAISPNLGNSEMPPTAPPQGFQFVHPVNPPLDQRAGDSMDPPRQPFVYNEPAPLIAPKTTWQWDNVLAARQPTGMPELPSPVSDTDLAPTQIRLAISPGGAVDHVLVEQSCGKADLDQQAVAAAQRTRFQSVDQTKPQWGRVTIFWHYSGRQREEVVPTPPTGP